MAQLVTKWLGANGSLHNTEAEADRSLSEHADLCELESWLERHIDFEYAHFTAEEVAIQVLRGFDIRPRAPGFDPRERILAALYAMHWASSRPEDVVSDLLEKFHITPRTPQ